MWGGRVCTCDTVKAAINTHFEAVPKEQVAVLEWLVALRQLLQTEDDGVGGGSRPRPLVYHGASSVSAHHSDHQAYAVSKFQHHAEPQSMGV